MNRKRTKAEREKFSATMREAAKRSWAKRRNGTAVAEQTAKKFYTPEKVAAITYAEATNKPFDVEPTMPRAVDGVIAKWSREADETFAALPFEKKAVLLGWLEKR